VGKAAHGGPRRRISEFGRWSVAFDGTDGDADEESTMNEAPVYVNLGGPGGLGLSAATTRAAKKIRITVVAPGSSIPPWRRASPATG
jgi:hypothetical protein